MTEEHLNHSGNEGFEKEDLSSKGVFYFMAGLAAITLVVYFILTVAYNALSKHEQKTQLPVNPMAVKTNADPRTMGRAQMQKQLENTFPKPVLEPDEGGELNTKVRSQDDVLSSYDWVDQEKGIVRIPIDKAMDLLAERGLPVRPEGNASAVPEKKDGNSKPVAKSTPSGD